MGQNFTKLSYSLIFGLILLATFLLPLFFLPTTSEFFEFNKFSLLLATTILGYLIWALRLFFEKRLVYTRTPLDLPILIILTIFLISTFASIDPFTSLVGLHGLAWPSFFVLVTIAAFYFLTTSNLKTAKQALSLLAAAVAGTLLASAVAIASFFGIYLPFDFAQSPTFSPMGAITSLALLQALILPIPLCASFYSKNSPARIFSAVATLAMAFSLILTNHLLAFIPLAASLLFLAAAFLKKPLVKSQVATLFLIATAIIIFLVLRFVPQVAKGILAPLIATKQVQADKKLLLEIAKEKYLPPKPGWDVAAQAVGKRPLLGTGPATFQYVYTQLKPRYVNQTDNWNLRFTRSSSDFTEIVATGGILGSLAYLLLLATIARFVWTLSLSGTGTTSYLPVAAAVVGFLTANFVMVSSLAIEAYFLTILAILAVLSKTTHENLVYEVSIELTTLRKRLSTLLPLVGKPELIIKAETSQKASKSLLMPVIFAAAVLVLSFLALRYQIYAYLAEYYFRQSNLAARSGDGAKTIQMLEKTIQANPRVDTYHRTLSQAALNAAINLAKKPDLADTDQQLLNRLIQVAIDQGKIASGYQILPLRLPGIAAANVANWEALAGVYQSLIGSVEGADVHATSTLAQAVALDPENPLLHDRLGQLYQRLANLDLAQRKFEDSVIVKTDYGPGHWRLAKILIERQADVAKIVNELNIAKRFLPSDDPAREELDKILPEYNQKLSQTQQKSSATPQASPTPNDSPSPRPSRSPSASPSPKPSF